LMLGERETIYYGRISRHEERDAPFRETYNSGEKRWMKYALP